MTTETARLESLKNALDLVQKVYWAQMSTGKEMTDAEAAASVATCNAWHSIKEAITVCNKNLTVSL